MEIKQRARPQLPKSKSLTQRETSSREQTETRQHRPAPTYRSQNNRGESQTALLGAWGVHRPREGVSPPVGTRGCLGLGSATLPPPAADLSFVLGQELPESRGLGGPSPGLVICNRTQEETGMGGMAQSHPHAWPCQLPHPT